MIPSAEKVIIDRLRETVTPKVYQIAPTQSPKEYVTVYRAGGRMKNIVTDRGLVVINCYADDPLRASDLANECRLSLLNCRGTQVGDTWVRWWEENAGPYFYPDPDRSGYRYQFSGEIDLAFHQ